MKTTQYIWSTSTTQPTSGWITFTNGTFISKNDCIVGNYYLWIKAIDNENNTYITHSNAFSITNVTISITPNTTILTNQNVIARITYPSILNYNRKAGVESANIVNATNVTVTSNSTVYAEATDIMGNKVNANKEITNIDKEDPYIIEFDLDKKEDNTNYFRNMFNHFETTNNDVYTQGNLIVDLDGSNNTEDGFSSNSTTWYNKADKSEATISGAIWNKKEKALTFDGIDDKVDLGNVYYTPTLTIETTFSVNSLHSGENTIFSNYENGGYGLTIEDGKIKFAVALITENIGGIVSGQVKDYTKIYSKTNIEIGKKYTVKASYDGYYLKLYVNDILESTSTEILGSIEAPDNNLHLMLGANPGNGYFFNGSIYSLKVYSGTSYKIDQSTSTMASQTKATDKNGIKEYRYYKDGELFYTSNSNKEIDENIIENLELFKTYKIKVEVEDNAGNIASREREYKHTNIIEINNISRDGFRIYFYTDELNIELVQCPTWTEYNWQDDVNWYSDMTWSYYSYTDNDGVFRDGYCYYKDITSENHKGESGVYDIDIYITSNDTLRFMCGTKVWVPDNELIKVKELGNEEFKVIYYPKITDISKVEFPVWTDKNGQDDIVWHQATKGTNGKYYYAKINITDSYNGEHGLYKVHCYATVNNVLKFIKSMDINL